MRRAIALLMLAVAACSSKPPQATPAPTAPAYRDEGTDWYLRSISADGRKVSIVYTISGAASGCEKKGFPFTDESPEKVFVIAYKSVARDKKRPCTQELGYIDATVTLRAPLG